MSPELAGQIDQINVTLNVGGIFLLCAALIFPMWIAAEIICYFSIKDPAFKNTVRFAVKLIFPWMYNFFYDYLNLVR